ncbi:MAG TPA: hypothetical protein VMR86_13570 [Myxococcota bacterium]|nr:hypothetical protein [Myxococcota bacterium]
MPGTARRSSSAETCTDSLGSLTRRELLVSGAAALAAAALLPGALQAHEGHDHFDLSEAAKIGLAKGKLVYVSPLKQDGSESRCHGEVWYFFDAGAVVIATATKGWKVRSVMKGSAKARIWVGDFGSYSGAKEKLASAPTFLTRAEIDRDPGTFERLLEAYGNKYPEEWGKWKPRFQSSHADGSRTVIRYTPIEA